MDGIFPCSNKRELKLFEQIPEIIHKEDPYFVPPFPGSVCKIFSPKAPFRRHGELYPLIAKTDGVPVGRIAAIVNHSHNKYYKDTTGFFGFFDCINDATVGKRLVDHARTILQNKGLTSMRGPYNPSINDECGVLAEGFESSPMVMMTYNPPYYLSLYEKLGLKPLQDLHAFYIRGDAIAPQRIERIVKRVKRSTGIKIRNVDLKNLKSDLRIIRDLYNRTLDRNWGFIPISYEDLEFAADDLKQIVNPEMVMIAEREATPVGFSLTIPNINEFMWKVKGSNTLMRILKFVYMLKFRHPREARLAILGVLPEYRNSGIAAAFYYETLIRGGKKYAGGELSWVEADNKDVTRAIEIMGGQQYKTYRIYENRFSA